MNIDHTRFYEYGFVLTVKCWQADRTLYTWHIERNDGVWMRLEEDSADPLSFDAAVEAGRAALKRHAGMEAFYEQYRTPESVA